MSHGQRLPCAGHHPAASPLPTSASGGRACVNDQAQALDHLSRTRELIGFADVVKARSRMNAGKHGERSIATVQLQRQARALLRRLGQDLPADPEAGP